MLWCARINGHVYIHVFKAEGSLVILFVFLYVCVFKYFSESTGPLEAKVYVEPLRDMGGKFIFK